MCIKSHRPKNVLLTIVLSSQCTDRKMEQNKLDPEHIGTYYIYQQSMGKKIKLLFYYLKKNKII